MVKLARTYSGMPKPYGKIGWFGESVRHKLAAQGIKTKGGNTLSPIAGYYKTSLTIPPMDRYEYEYQQLGNEFDELWKQPKTPKRDEQFMLLRVNKMYPLLRKILMHREKRSMPKVRYDDVPLVLEASRGNDGHIEWIDPNDFLRLAKHASPDIDKILKLYEGYKSGHPYDVGFIEVDENNKVYGHEGRHRAFVAKIFGWKKIPVAIHGEGHKKFNPKTTKPEWGGQDFDSEATRYLGDLYASD